MQRALIVQCFIWSRSLPFHRPIWLQYLSYFFAFPYILLIPDVGIVRQPFYMELYYFSAFATKTLTAGSGGMLTAETSPIKPGTKLSWVRVSGVGVSARDFR